MKVRVVNPPAFEVSLISKQSDAVPILSMLTRAYAGHYSLAPAGTVWLEDLGKTALQTPLEFINMVWLLKGVTRAFTHQLVRTRIGVAYVQESMRFAVLEEPIRVLLTEEYKQTDYPANVKHVYEVAARTAVRAYDHLLQEGVPRQCARGILPTNILTSIYWSVNLRTLQTVMRQRLCCQADQNEWVPILLEMRRQLVAAMGKEVKPFLLSNKERDEDCGYKASFDRPCSWTDGVPDA